MIDQPPRRGHAPGTPRSEGDDWERVVDAILDPIAIADPSGRLRRANRAFRQRFAAADGAIDGRLVAELLFGDGSEAIGSAGVTYETAELRAPGTYLVSQQPVRLAGGPGVLYHLTDLTALRAAEQAARDSERQARQAQKLEALGRLGAGLAHDFNNLLTTVLCNVEMLEASTAAVPGALDSLAQVRTAAERGASLVARLLRFGSPRPGRLEVVDVAAHLRDTARLLGG